MPWKRCSKEEQRFELVRQIIAGTSTVSALCRRFGVCRQTAYKWFGRYRLAQLRGLSDRSRRPRHLTRRTDARWLRRVRDWRARHPTWGARKLRHCLCERFGTHGAPAVATINRWLRHWGLSRGRRRRQRGPTVIVAAPPPARRCHEVWTVDFKGWYRTASGLRVEPLTVRDLHSRYVLCVALLRSPALAQTRQHFRKLFKVHGRPRRIRCDNGTPFGGGGPTRLTRLSAWWIKLGIEVEFITPGRPGENGAHEQFHQVYQAEVAAQPERTRRAQQVRSTRWLDQYNRFRPHEALGMKRPADLFRRNRRRLPVRLAPWTYPKDWERCWVRGNGEISHCGVRRYVGEAFVRDYVGLKPFARGVWRVYFGPVLIGELRDAESGSLRMARYRRAR
jgi:transposase InsO family protein